jgi:predicted nucleic acid-binding protein
MLEFDQAGARFSASISAHLRDIGRPAPDMDILIAATAMAAGHMLVTDNVSHFADIRQLAVETY